MEMMMMMMMMMMMKTTVRSVPDGSDKYKINLAIALCAFIWRKLSLKTHRSTSDNMLKIKLGKFALGKYYR